MMEVCCSSEKMPTDPLSVGDMPEITADSGISQMSWGYSHKYVSVVCLFNVVMKLAEFGLSSGG